MIPEIIISRSRQDTFELGRRLGARLQAGDVICLSGDLGAGKTVLAAGIGAGWGLAEPLVSPTFVIVHQHERDGQRLYHLDAYRLESEADAASIGLEDILDGESVVLIEWPERIADWLPSRYLWIDLESADDDPDTRRITLTQVNGGGANAAGN